MSQRRLEPPLRARACRAACFALVWLLAHAAHSATVTATIDRPVVTLGESVTLSLTFDANVGQAPDLPPLPNFSLAGRGQALQFANGQVQQTFTYQLLPAQPGDFVIPGLQFNFGGQVLTTRPIAVKVLNPGQAPPGSGPPPHFAKIMIPKTQLYVGEAVEAEVQVHFQEGRLRQYPQLPADSGFTIGKWQQPVETRVAVSNVAYGLVTFKVPIIPVKAGPLTLGPATLPIYVPDRSRRPDFFFQNEREIRLTADKVLVTVFPLPTNNVPASFAGAVGDYSVQVSAAPATVAVGDPITARIQVSGRGWLDAVTLPPQPQWSDFKMYPPNARVEGSDANNTSGTKTFEVVVVPQNPGIKALPPFAFSFLDPHQRAYRTVNSPAIPLNVTAGAASTTPLPTLAGATNATDETQTDVAHIKVRLGAATPAAPLIARPWFLGLQLVAPILWAALVIRRKRTEALTNNPRRRRRQEVEKFVATGLRQLREHAGARDSDAFFATVFRLLQEQLGERLDVSSSSITEAVIEERLRREGLSDATCATLHELFQACNLARYAPVKSSQELSALVPKVETALRDVQQWEPAR